MAEGENYGYQYFLGGEQNIAEEHRRRVLHQVRVRRNLRQTTDPFSISVTEFIRLYRMPQHLVLNLTELLRPYLRPRRGVGQANYIPPELKVLCAVRFFAGGSYQRGCRRSADINFSQSTVSNSITEVTAALNHPLILRRFIRFPMNAGEREAVIQRNDRLGIERVLGFLDGKLIKIVPPAGPDKQIYRCRKGFSAINVQMICDADLYIMNMNAQFPGSSNDPFIYRMSGVRDAARQAFRETRCWLLADSIYPHEPWCMKPILHAQPGTPEYSYTRLHCKCRVTIERCIGVLKGRWRCLLCDRTLHYDPVKAGFIVNSCAVLHNYLLEHRAPAPPPVYEHLVRGYAEAVLPEDLNLVQEADEVQRFLIDSAHRRWLRLHQGD